MIKWDLSQGCKDGSIHETIKIICHTNESKDRNRMILAIDAESFWQDPTSIYNKNPQQNRSKRSLPQDSKGYL